MTASVASPDPEALKQRTAAVFDRSAASYDQVGVDFFTPPRVTWSREPLCARANVSSISERAAAQRPPRWAPPGRVVGADGGIAESSTRYRARLGGIGEWRPTGTARFAGYFEKFAFPAGQTTAAAWVRVEFVWEIGRVHSSSATGGGSC